MSRLAAVRRDWLGTPDRLIRAARHYERAAQTLVRLSVMRVMERVQLGSAERPEEGVWVTARCPARADIAGQFGRRQWDGVMNHSTELLHCS